MWRVTRKPEFIPCFSAIFIVSIGSVLGFVLNRNIPISGFLRRSLSPVALIFSIISTAPAHATPRRSAVHFIVLVNFACRYTNEKCTRYTTNAPNKPFICCWRPVLHTFCAFLWIFTVENSMLIRFYIGVNNYLNHLILFLSFSLPALWNKAIIVHLHQNWRRICNILLSISCWF